MLKPYRYKTLYGGRAGAKSHSAVELAVALASQQRPLRILCVREVQNSIRDSVHKLIADKIQSMELENYFDVMRDSIVTKYAKKYRTEFIFKGLFNNLYEIKSTEGIDLCLVEEAQNVSKESWEILIPTIRKPESEIWTLFNTGAEDDETYKRFVANPYPNSFTQRINFYDNPHCPQVMIDEAMTLRERDYEAYEHIWLGRPKKIGDSIIFNKRWTVTEFDTPPQGFPNSPRFFQGLDFGFANDPNAFIRCWVDDDILYIDQALFGWRIEIDEIPQWLDQCPTARTWPIHADCARPETISYLLRHGFNCTAAEKWEGCVEDGIQHLKGFREIRVHPRCRHLIDEFRLYSYKVDKQTGEVLPIIIDKYNHGIDALRYSLDGYIMRRGSGGVWAKLAG